MHHETFTYIDQIHILLALIIMASYLAIPFTALRKLPMPRVARIYGTAFFATCAITHLAVAAGFHDSPWMVVNDLIQAVSAIGFITRMSRMVAVVLAERAARDSEGK